MWWVARVVYFWETRAEVYLLGWGEDQRVAWRDVGGRREAVRVEGRGYGFVVLGMKGEEVGVVSVAGERAASGGADFDGVDHEVLEGVAGENTAGGSVVCVGVLERLLGGVG